MNPEGHVVMKWDDAGDKKLFLAIIGYHYIQTDLEAVAAQLGCSPRAVEERMKNLRKQAKRERDIREKDLAEKAKNGGLNDPAVGVQKKRGPKPKPLTGAESEDDEDDLAMSSGGGSMPPPTKKRKADNEAIRDTDGSAEATSAGGERGDDWADAHHNRNTVVIKDYGVEEMSEGEPGTICHSG